ncbi:MAG: type III-B CRISPR module-associated protein Cmr5 [Desulfobulbaceae bacterium]|nr:type III-B CRISPR module-associated protein Cmr5 [Desulfobulbaceae bacterium]
MKRMAEQERALYCLEFIKSYGDENKADQTKLATHIQKAPIRIIQNGLGQMLAFLLADNEGKRDERDKKAEPSYHLYCHIEKWLQGAGGRTQVIYNNEYELIEQITRNSRQDYMRAQEETLALFNWLKKFADAWLYKGGK